MDFLSFSPPITGFGLIKLGDANVVLIVAVAAAAVVAVLVCVVLLVLCCRRRKGGGAAKGGGGAANGAGGAAKNKKKKPSDKCKIFLQDFFAYLCSFHPTLSIYSLAAYTPSFPTFKIAYIGTEAYQECQL